jgi:signal transduction histidine kinase
VAIPIIKRIHHKIFLAYGAVFLVTIGGVFGAASLFIKRNFDLQIQQDAQAFRTRIADTIHRLRQDIEEKVRLETQDPFVFRAIRRKDALSLPDMEKSALEILEYGDEQGVILSSKGDTDLRQGATDAVALDNAQRPEPRLLIRLRTPEKRATIEVSSSIQRGDTFWGFVTGGYYLQDRLRQTLKDQALHPIFLKVADELAALNAPADAIPEDERERLLTAQRRRLVGLPYNVSRVPIPSADDANPAELIIAYSNRNEVEFRNKLLIVLLTVAGVGLGFAYVISFVIGLRITKPIHHLVRGATAVASGNLEHTVPVQSRDEIGQLAKVFNQMAADLKANIEKRLVAERMAAWQEVARRVAHEIKNPLFPIRLSVENLRRTYRSKPAVFGEIFDECTETVIEEVGRLQRMVDEFHQFARMPAPQRKPSDLNQIVRNVVNLYAESAPDVQVKLSLERALPALSIDPEQIAQALGNLIKNAIEAMPDGGTLEISTQLLNDAEVQIEIKDTGVGMSLEILSEIFKPYYTTKESGAGLGMAIVQRIVSDHNGKINIESAEGVGTTVRVELPLQV